LRISVLIATWRRPDDLRRCLAALDAQILGADEILVVVRADDAQTWAALDGVRLAAPVLRTISVDAHGVVAAMNAGLDAATGEIVAMTDDDTAPRPDWLERIHAHLEQRSDVAGVGGRDWQHLDSGIETGTQAVVAKLYPYGRLTGNQHLGSGGPREVDVLKGANMAFRRAALDGIRLDERLRGTGAQWHWELALGLAVKRAGWRLMYDPAIAVDHYLAERFDEDQRANRPLLALANEVHNETYALLRWLPWWHKITAFTYGVLIGTRRAPGALTAVERCLREPDRSALRARFLAAQQARLAGLWTFVRASREQ